MNWRGNSRRGSCVCCPGIRWPVAGAVGYVLNQWAPLRVFLEDGAVALDNNLVEQEMKRIALLRKNAPFVGSERGGATAAILSSITSTCRRLGINRQLYLTQLLVNLPSLPMSFPRATSRPR